MLFLEPTRLYRLLKEEVPDEEYTIPLEQARIAQEGSAVTLVAWGSMLERSLRAAAPYDVEIIDLMTLNPFDEATLLASVRKTGRLVIVNEAAKTGGFGAEIAATVAEAAILHLRAPVLRVAGYDVVPPLPMLEEANFPSEQRIARAIEEVLKY